MELHPPVLVRMGGGMDGFFFLAWWARSLTLLVPAGSTGEWYHFLVVLRAQIPGNCNLMLRVCTVNASEILHQILQHTQ